MNDPIITTSTIQNFLDNKIKAVEIEINTQCNLSCSYCPNHLKKNKRNDIISFELFTNIIQQLKDLNFTGRLSFDFYNEPFLHPNIISLINYAKQQIPEINIVLYSNGILITYEVFQQLVNAKVTKIFITHHEQINKLPINSFYDSLSDNQKNIVEVMQHDNITKFNRAGILNEDSTKIKPLTPCYLPSFIFVISHNGDVLGCFDDANRKNIFGNLYKNTIIEIWNSKKFITFRTDLRYGKRHKYSTCVNCNRTNVLPSIFDR